MSSKDDNIASPATDVFAYGIIVMEVMSGQTPEMLLGTQEKEEENRVPEWKRLRGVITGEMEMLREVMDSTLGESYSVESAYEMARLATDCTAEEAELRPTAAEIVERVSRLVDEDDDDAVIIERDHNNNTLISESSYKPLVRKGGSSSIIDEF
ncbi:Protein LYK2 [Raphanus sativus]|nr:Protein LYK2 [Raphanus sativus]